MLWFFDKSNISVNRKLNIWSIMFKLIISNKIRKNLISETFSYRRNNFQFYYFSIRDVTVRRSNGHENVVTWLTSHCDLDAKNSKKVWPLAKSNGHTYPSLADVRIRPAEGRFTGIFQLFIYRTTCDEENFQNRLGRGVF